MSGTIAVQPDRRWSAASWVFDWVVSFVDRRVADGELTRQLREIVDENLGWVDIPALPANDRVLAAIRDDLVPAAIAELPPTVPDRDAVIDHLRELADLARTAR